MRNALYAVGAPILMSASSTILGVSFLASAESYVFRSFLKTIVLVIVLGIVTVIPVKFGYRRAPRPCHPASLVNPVPLWRG